MGFLDKINSQIKDIRENGDTFKPLPDGWYDATITSMEIRPTKSGGKALFITFTTENPKRNIFTIENIENSNPKAEEIAHRNIAKLATACGIEQLDDVFDLGNNEVSILLGTKQDDNYPPRNIVKTYSPYGAQTAAPIQAKKPAANNSMLPHGLHDMAAKQPTRPAPKRAKPAIDVDQEFDDDIGF
jgi:hypothetical protein